MAERPQDVAAGINFARENGFAIAVQGTGHGVMLPGNDAVLINTSRFQDVRVNAETQTAWVGGGVKWKKVIEAANPLGLAPLLGSSSDVGVVGYTLGGGMGWLARKYGYSADSVNMIEVVTPDGEIRHASATENTDLFWGLRGGGGNFGVVTGLEIKLYPVKVLYGGTLWYPPEMLGDALRFFRYWIKHVPDEMTSSVSLMSYPPFPELPEAIRGKKFTQIKFGFSGAPEWGKLLVDEWRAWIAPMMDQVGVMPFTEVDKISDDPVDPLPAYIANELFDELSDQAIEVFVRYTLDDHAPMVFTTIRHMGGAMAAADRSANAIGNRDALYVAEMLGITPTLEAEDQYVAYLKDFKDALYPYANGGVYLNFLGRRELKQRAPDAYAPGNYQRLQALKAKYDPTNMFRFSFDLTAAEPEAITDWETQADEIYA
jgi:FAD/FMN-containing dehydrogenase